MRISSSTRAINRALFTTALTLGSLAGFSSSAFAQKNDTLARALAMKPLQDPADVPYDTVPEDKIAACSIEEVTRDEGKGLLITGDSGQTLRWFVDTNGDRFPDRWCYYAQGVEIFREIDTDFDRTADQFRWLGTAGTRWGIDENKDGTIDRWQSISAEEVTYEIVRAISTRDANRFACVVASDAEIDALELGKEKSEALKQKTKDARRQFKDWAAGQAVVTRNSKWSHFGADKPGIVPAGTDGAKKDITVYENVVALLETNEKPQQLLIGTLIQVGNAWRAADLPKAVTEGAELSDAGMFFSASFSNRGQAAAAAGAQNSGMSKAIERLLGQLQEADEKLQAAAGADKPKCHAARADVLERLISASETDEDRTTWIHQFADTVNAASQTGEYPEGAERLTDMLKRLPTVTKSDDDLAYVAYRAITAEYTQSIQNPNGDFAKAQQAYHNRLEQFVKQYPKAPDAADAMVQIGIGAELVGDNVIAIRWYTDASQKFSDTLSGKKAAGAIKRLDLKGKKFTVAGKTLAGKEIHTRDMTGGPIIFHYWASWCDSCKAEMRALKELRSQFSKEKLRIVGINVDSDPKLAKDFLKENDFGWDHIYEPGGLDGNLAVGLGVFNLPVNIVVDSQSQVVKSGVHYSELQAILEGMSKK